VVGFEGMKLYGVKVTVLNSSDQILLLKRADHLPSPGRGIFVVAGLIRVSLLRKLLKERFKRSLA